MSSEPKSPSVSRTISVIVPLCIGLGVCHSVAYWSRFGINPLAFVSVVDVAKFAIYPLLGTVLTYVLVLTFTEVATANVRSGAGANTRIGQFLHTHWRTLTLFVLLAIANVLVFVPPPYRWMVVALLASLLSSGLTHVNFLVDHFPNPRQRAVLAAFVVSAPFLVYGHGESLALRALRGESELYIDVIRSGVDGKPENGSSMAFLGRLGDTYFGLEHGARKLILLRHEAGKQLVLMRAAR